jgi:hypothetical protein
MVRIYLNQFEYAHYEDLTSRMPAVFKLPDHDTAEGLREVRIKALENVIGFDYPRQRLGGKPFEVYGGRSEQMARWQ